MRALAHWAIPLASLMVAIKCLAGKRVDITTTYTIFSNCGVDRTTLRATVRSKHRH
jgi:hypothetical protein